MLFVLFKLRGGGGEPSLRHCSCMQIHSVTHRALVLESMSPVAETTTAEPVNGDTKHVSPLDQFRREASFDWKKMRLNIEDLEQYAVKVRTIVYFSLLVTHFL